MFPVGDCSPSFEIKTHDLCPTICEPDTSEFNEDEFALPVLLLCLRGFIPGDFNVSSGHFLGFNS